ncbi:MAG TPA: hypothetical protein PLN94_06380 [Thiolinea sp.]|nr:hypothetical protein [Thiolinea sp.]
MDVAYAVSLKLVAFAAAGFAVYKSALILQAFGLQGLLVFSGMHLPLALWGAAYTVWASKPYPGVALLAAVMTVFCSVLI